MKAVELLRRAVVMKTAAVRMAPALRKAAPFLPAAGTATIGGLSNEYLMGEALGDRYKGSTALASLIGGAAGLPFGSRRGRSTFGITRPKWYPEPGASKATGIEGLGRSRDVMRVPGMMTWGTGVPTLIAPLTSGQLSGDHSLIRDLVGEYRNLREAGPDAGAVTAGVPEAVKKIKDVVIGKEGDTSGPSGVIRRLADESGLAEKARIAGPVLNKTIKDVGGSIVGSGVGSIGGAALANWLFGPKEINPGEELTEEEHKARARKRMIANILGAVGGGVAGHFAGQAAAHRLFPGKAIPTPGSAPAPASTPGSD